ncbi:MAG: bifunctional phosphoglucose/phosphomannose isomerase [Acidimicrobiia bacterium]
MTDSLRFVEAVGGLPEQLTAAHEEAASTIDVSGLGAADDITNIVVLGMGGSGIAGDVLAAVGSGGLPVPVTVLKQYRTPRFVGPNTLAFAVSYSGDTEETVEMATGALDNGARVVAVSRGGRLAELVAERGGLHVSCPADVPVPRAALGALVAPLFVTLFRLGMAPDARKWLTMAQKQLGARRKKCRPEVEGAANPAREIARRIGTTIPLFYGGGALGAAAAMRWKCDVNENAKAPAFWNAYPELDHNEICGWGQHGDVTRQMFTLVELRHGYEHPQLARRFSATREIIEETVAQVLEVQAEGETRLAQVLDLMYTGDWASCYLAFDHDVDPGPVDAITQLKEAIAERG